MEKKLAETYKIKATESNTFKYKGIHCFYMTAVPVGSDDVEAFVLPHNPMWNTIVRRKRMNGMWHPDEKYVWTDVYLSNFEGSSYINPSQKLWLHETLVSSVDEYAKDVSTNGYLGDSLIQNWSYKREQLHNQYCSAGWITTFPSFRSYVEALSEDDMNFFIWLFDNPALSGYDSFSLPTQYNNAFQEFLRIC